MKKFFTLIAAFIASSAMMAQEIEWTADSLVNGNLEGDDYSAFHLRPNSPTTGNTVMGDDGNPAELDGAELDFQAGYGVDGSKGLKIVSYKGAENAWQNQFWVRLPHVLEAGDNVKVSFDYRAKSQYFADMAESGEEGSLKFDTQSHTAACSYIYYSFAGSPSTTNEEWQHWEAEVTIDGSMAGSSGMGSMAFNLSNCADYDVEWYFDNFTVQFEKPNVNIVKYWSKLIQNGNMEGDTFDSFVFRLYQKGDQDIASLIEEGAGVDDSRALKLVVPAKAANDWDTQFFIKLKEPMLEGEMIKLTMDIRASEDGISIDSQSHGLSAGAYNHWACVGSPSFSTEWKTYTNSVSVSSSMSPEGKEFQYIAFNLAKNDHEVTLYFDNIDVRVRREGDASLNPDLIELNSAIDDASELYSNADGTPANKDVREAFKAAYDAAEEAANYSGEEAIDYEAPMYALTNAKSKFTQSIGEYESLLYYINFTTAKAEEAKAMGDDYLQLYEDLDARQSTMTEAYNAEEMVKASMNEAGYLSVTPVMDMIKAAVNAETIKVGDDVTILLPNAHYDNNGYDWNGTSVTVRAGVAEKWHATFDHNQTIVNLPAGAYEISAQAFQRRDMPGEDDTWEQDAMNVKLYANNGYIYVSDLDNVVEALGLEEVPSSMETAADLFATGACVNALNVVLAEAGDLKVGIKTDAKYTWAIWDNFKVIYKGADVESYAEAIKAMLNVATELLDHTITDPAEKDLNAIIAKAEDLADDANLTEAQASEAVDALVAAIEATKANEAALAAADAAYWDEFSGIYGEYGDNATTAVKERAAKADALSETMESMTTEELEAYTAELKYLSKALIIPGESESATDEAPYDLTDVLVTLGVDVDFEDYSDVGANKNYPGWSGSGFGTGGGTAGPVGERWNQTSGFNTYVKLQGLPEGIYELACDGAYRVGAAGSINDYNLAQATDSVDARIPYLYATTSVGTEKTNLPNVYSVLVTEEIALEKGFDFSSSDNATISVAIDSVTTVKYLSPQQLATANQFMQAGYYQGTKVAFKVGADGEAQIGVRLEKGASNNWTFVDNFTLVYYGANSAIVPTTIEGVQTVAAKAIYTITGVRVANANKTGLYIINGKKVLVK